MASLQAVYEDFSACCDDFVEGVTHLKDRAMPKAVSSFQQAYESVDHADVYHNKYASYCGLARVLSGDEVVWVCVDRRQLTNYMMAMFI